MRTSILLIIKLRESAMKKAIVAIFCILFVGCAAAVKKQTMSLNDEQIHNVMEKLAEAMSARDLDGILSVYSEDATLTTTDKNKENLIVSRKEFGEILSDWKLKHYEKIGLKAELVDVKDIKITGNKAEARATFKWTGYTFESGDSYKYALEKKDGQWLILRELK